MPQRYHLHPDASAIYLACQRLLHAGEFGLVIGCARAGDRPDWHPEIKPITWQPERWIYDDKATTRRAPEVCNKPAGIGSYCPVKIEDNSKRITMHRENYLSWWQALHTVMMDCTNLREHIVTGVGAPREPWHSETETQISA